MLLDEDARVSDGAPADWRILLHFVHHAAQGILGQKGCNGLIKFYRSHPAYERTRVCIEWAVFLYRIPVSDLP